VVAQGWSNEDQVTGTLGAKDIPGGRVSVGVTRPFGLLSVGQLEAQLKRTISDKEAVALEINAATTALHNAS
jgi:hypothetical protein